MDHCKDIKQIINLEATFQDNENLYYLLELAQGGSLRDQIQLIHEKSLKLSDIQIKFLVAELLLGLEGMHHNHICHRDLKPDNILFSRNGKQWQCENM